MVSSYSLLKLGSIFAFRANRLLRFSAAEPTINKDYFKSGLKELDNKIKEIVSNYTGKFLQEEDIQALQEDDDLGAGLYYELTTLPNRIQQVREESAEIVTSIDSGNTTSIPKLLSSLNQQISNVKDIISKGRDFDKTLFLYDDGDLAQNIEQYLTVLSNGLVAYFNWTHSDLGLPEEDEIYEETEVPEDIEDDLEGPTKPISTWDATKEHQSEYLPIKRDKINEKLRDWYRFISKINPSYMKTKRERAREFHKRMKNDPSYKQKKLLITKKHKQTLSKNFLEYEKLRNNPLFMSEMVRNNPDRVALLKKHHAMYINELAVMRNRKREKQLDQRNNKLLQQLGIDPKE